MSQIFLIQQSFVEKYSSNEPIWVSLYCVKSKQAAIDDCKRMQEDSDSRYSNASFKFIYTYQKLDLF